MAQMTIQKLLSMKTSGQKIAMLTAYDFSFARLFDLAGIDILLVGDSASNVMAGNSTTLPITLDHIIYHAQCVCKAVSKSMVVVDLPFGYYQSNTSLALSSAIRILKETGANAVKLEGGEEIADSICAIVKAGIPVMGHLGLTPQSINQFGTFAVRATENVEAAKLKKDAILLQELGCFSIVLEKIPANLAVDVSKSLLIPTIGIGAGVDCDGQVLVMHDLLGMNNNFNPKFVRKYLQLENQIISAVKCYINDVKELEFPNKNESY